MNYSSLVCALLARLYNLIEEKKSQHSTCRALPTWIIQPPSASAALSAFYIYTGH